MTREEMQEKIDLCICACLLQGLTTEDTADRVLAICEENNMFVMHEDYSSPTLLTKEDVNEEMAGQDFRHAGWQESYDD